METYSLHKNQTPAIHSNFRPLIAWLANKPSFSSNFSFVFCTMPLKNHTGMRVLAACLRFLRAIRNPAVGHVQEVSIFCIGGCFDVARMVARDKFILTPY